MIYPILNVSRDRIQVSKNKGIIDPEEAQRISDLHSGIERNYIATQSSKIEWSVWFPLYRKHRTLSGYSGREVSRIEVSIAMKRVFRRRIDWTIFYPQYVQNGIAIIRW